MSDSDCLETETQIYDALAKLAIRYESFSHKPVATVAEALEVSSDISGSHVKNLFLRDKKKNYFLITAEYQTPIDLKALRHVIGASGNLSFGSAESLWELLWVRPGSVNPFSMFYAHDKGVRFFLDSKLAQAPSLNLHPMRNDKSITLATQDLLKFLDAISCPVTILDL